MERRMKNPAGAVPNSHMSSPVERDDDPRNFETVTGIPRIQVPHIKRLNSESSSSSSLVDELSKELHGNKNMSNNPFLHLYKSLELNKRNCTTSKSPSQGESSKSKCTPVTEGGSSTRITIIQGNHRLEPPYDFVTKNAKTGARRVLCFPLVLNKFVGEESEVPT
ncbi:hypothetical protein RUM43_005973 [Polyplax serrata]|uniref:Uncharacterized protein n=1 Tax=Polyplax serrata TaxID=468196 RepID=A0AAN8S8W0_POLSC